MEVSRTRIEHGRMESVARDPVADLRRRNELQRPSIRLDRMASPSLEAHALPRLHDEAHVAGAILAIDAVPRDSLLDQAQALDRDVPGAPRIFPRKLLLH